MPMNIRFLLQTGSLIMFCFCKPSLALTTSMETNVYAMGQVLDHSCGLYLTCQNHFSEFYDRNSDGLNVIIPGDTYPYNYGAVSVGGTADLANNSFTSYLAVLKGTQIGSYANGGISTAIGNTYAIFNQDGSLYTGGGLSMFIITASGLWSSANQNWFTFYGVEIGHPGYLDARRSGDLSALSNTYIDSSSKDVEIQDPFYSTYYSVLEYYFPTPSHPFSWTVSMLMSSDYNFTDSSNAGTTSFGLLDINVTFHSPSGTYASILDSNDPLLANYINSSPIGSGQTSIINAPATLFLIMPMLFLLPRLSTRRAD